MDAEATEAGHLVLPGDARGGPHREFRLLPLAPRIPAAGELTPSHSSRLLRRYCRAATGIAMHEGGLEMDLFDLSVRILEASE